ncbi:MAG: PQQ-like beta-propeller repeat protein [Verrucomicrobia bacterium]|jgi:outer membrane protein assembly factor BamB|nr:PQQ-like beta-propeller repeat protein [Verrucomicrobiota bacterium]
MTSIRSILPFLCFTSWFYLHAEITDWTRFRGPQGSGISTTADLPLKWSENNNLTWQVDLPGEGASSPIVWKDHIYLTAFTSSGNETEALKRHVLCLNRTDGREIWRRTVFADLPEQENIRENHGYATNSPAVDENRVYVFFGKSGVMALNHHGKELWRTRVGSRIHGWGSAASPVLHNGLVIINASVESESLIALDGATGKKVWNTPGIKESWNTPIIAELDDGSHEIILAMFRKVLGVDPASGKILWECDTKINWYMCPGMLFHDGVVYAIGGRSGGGLAVKAGGRGDVTNTHLLWRLDKGTNVPTPIYHDEHLYFIHENLAIAYCIDAKSGKTIYEERIQPSPGQIYPSPFLANGRIHYLSRRGECVVLPAEPRFEILARNILPKSAGVYNASPTLMGNQLLIRADKTLFCIGHHGE